jgi:hypothetical protein
MEEYTFTFKTENERKFRQVMDRLEPDEYVVIQDIHDPRTEEEKTKYEKYLQCTLGMEPEAALTFRMSMTELNIKRKRSDEDQAKEDERQNRNVIKVRVSTGPMGDA